MKTIPVDELAKGLSVRLARLEDKMHKLGLHANEMDNVNTLTINDARTLINSYVQSKRVSTTTKIRAQELCECLLNYERTGKWKPLANVESKSLDKRIRVHKRLLYKM